MFTKCLTVAALFGVVLGLPMPENPPPIYSPNINLHEKPYEKPHYKLEKRPYAFDYGVKDDYTGANYGHQEDSDGDVIKGSYTVALPDGRLQRVTYTADHVNGFQAEVTYEGEATYPDHKPQKPTQYDSAPHNIPYKPQHSAPQPIYAPSPRFQEESQVLSDDYNVPEHQ